jgi:hypothetical protein
MTKATIETYTVKTRNFEYRAPKPTLEAAISVAREKVWPIAPDEKVQVYRGEELVGEIERVESSMARRAPKNLRRVLARPPWPLKQKAPVRRRATGAC